MKTVTLKQVEDYLRKNPKEKLYVNEEAFFINTNAWYDEEVVEDAGSDIKFIYHGTTLRRFDQANENKFQHTGFFSTADEAMKAARAILALECVFSTPLEVQ